MKALLYKIAKFLGIRADLLIDESDGIFNYYKNKHKVTY